MLKAIVIFNFGAPQCEKEIFSYQVELFKDPEIIDLPIGSFGRAFLAYLIATLKRKKSIAKYRLIGGTSPLNKITESQRVLLEKYLERRGETVKVFTAMKYSKPNLDDCLLNLKTFGAREVTFIPLFPHFSKVTTGGFWRQLETKIKNYDFNVKKIKDYFINDYFIDSWIWEIRGAFSKISDLTRYHLLFSAHGLPEKIILKGDPYKDQIEATVNAIVAKLDYKIEFSISYQSRSGPGKWLEPATENVLKNLARKKKKVILVPISFVSDNFETLYENDIELADYYKANGGEEFIRVPSLNTSEKFIECLGELYLHEC